MTGFLQPLDQKFAIVDSEGRPTLYFTKWAQQKQIDIGDSIQLTDLQAYLDAHVIVAGTGIQFSPGPNGDLNKNPTIHADAQAILDEITATRGAILYRGLLGWAGLLPGTAGNVLQTNGAGADPTWVAPAAGGSGALTLLASNVLAAATATVSFTGIAQTYRDLIVVGQARSTKAATTDEVLIQYNGDTAAHYDFERENRFGTATTFNTTFIDAASIPGSTGPANVADDFEAIVGNYAATVFHKMTRVYSENMTSVSQFFRQITSGRWQSTAAVNRIDLLCQGGNFVVGSTFSLYGRQ